MMMTTWCQERLAHIDNLEREGLSRGRRRQTLRATMRAARKKAAFIRALSASGNRNQARLAVGWRPGAIADHRRQDPAFAALDRRLAGASDLERLSDEIMTQVQIYLLDCDTLALLAEHKIHTASDPPAVEEVDFAELAREAAAALGTDSADDASRRLAGRLAIAATAVARLQRIEEAACAVLDRGTAWYAAEEEWVGDLVPADAMAELRAAVEGETTADVAVGPDDDGCPVGDPDCDLPADSLHEWCEAPDARELAR